MNPNLPQLGRCVATAALLVLPLASADTNHWNISLATIGSDGKIAIQGLGDRKIQSEDPAITIVDDAEAPGGKALAFSGAQMKLPTAGGPYEGGGSIRLSLRVKPDLDLGANEQTILAHSGVYELRYSPKRNDLSVYFPQDDAKVILYARVPMPAGKWSSVEVLVKDRDVRLTVDSTTDAMVFPEGTLLRKVKSYLKIGAMGDNSRPFKGRLADIMVAEPAD